MEEKERYISKKIIKDVVMPAGLYEIKDRESDFYLIIENKKDVDTITNLLNKLNKENQQLKQQLKDTEELGRGGSHGNENKTRRIY